MSCAAVQVLETCFVSPSEGTPKKQMWISTLDNLLAYRGHTPTVYLYRSSSTAAADFFSVARLKESMARALVPFYPLAGRLSVDTADGQLVIDCNAEGALLVVARSDLTLAHFVDLKPTPELKMLFVPRVEPSSIMLAIQVTFLKCGGVALGTAFHHVAGDAISAFHFFQTWSTLSRSSIHGATVPLFSPPCHDRSLLRARSPPSVHPDALSLFCKQLSLAPPSEPVVNEVFTISNARLAALKLAGGGHVSTFCAIAALVWRCACVARGLRPDSKARLTLPANIRRSLKPSLPDSYFGNAIIFLETVALARDVTSESLADTASRIRRVVARMDDEVARSAIDCYKLAESDGRSRPSGSLPVTELRVVSWLGMPVYEADYGWGKPEMFLGAESSRQGLVHLMSDGGDGVRVLVSVEASSMEEFGQLLYANLPCSV